MNAEAHEVEFWRGFVATERFLSGWCADVPTPELRPLVRDFLLARPEARVLDVGSGVVSLLHGTARDLVAVDVLAENYAKLFDYAKAGITAPLPIAAEELPFVESFDVVHISNALDHCRDPQMAMRRLQKAVRPDGWLIVQSFEDEGTHQRWAGMHQWNLSVDGLALEARDGVGTYRLGVADEVHLYATAGDRRWFVWMCQK